MTKKVQLNQKKDTMTSNFWLKGCKFSAVVGTTLGLLMPALPLLAVAPSSNLAEDSSFAQSGELLIAQSGCSRATMIEQFTTDTYKRLHLSGWRWGLFLSGYQPFQWGFD